MQFKRKLSRAAHRHMMDADALKEQKRWDNAGYHYGLAAECGVKAAFEKLGFKEVEFIDEDDLTKDALWVHFPNIKRVDIAITGRISQIVSKKMKKDSNFLQGWTVRMRYAEDTVNETTCDRWRSEVDEFLRGCLSV